MAASDIRRMTKDADLSTHGIVNDEDRVPKWSPRSPRWNLSRTTVS